METSPPRNSAEPRGGLELELNLMLPESNHKDKASESQRFTPLDAALAYLRSGLSVIPIRADGSKAPAVPWEEFQSRLPTEEELRRWFADARLGLGVVAGKVSGNLEHIDFDTDAQTIFPAWCELVEVEAPSLLGLLSVRTTPAGGYHVSYRCPEVPIPGNTKLACDPSAPSGEQTLIETRGEGGYALAPGCPPSCHPSGRLYQHHRGPKLSQVQEITAAEREVLLRNARSFDRSAQTEPRQTHNVGGSLRPGDQFSASGPDWSEILTGWTEVRRRGDIRYWRRPGKDGSGWSATTGACTNKAGYDLLAVFSSNAQPFEGPANGRPCSCYSKFSAYALLHHDGAFAAAAKALGQLRYGDPPHGANGRHHGHGTPPYAEDVGTAPKAKRAARPLMPYKSFPVEFLPDPLRSYVCHCALALGCDPAYVALPALAVVASAIGNTRTIRLKRGWEEPCVLWSIVLGDSGTLKSPAYDKAVGHLLRVQKRLSQNFEMEEAQYKAELLAYKKAKNKEGEPPTKPTRKRVVCSDITIETVAEVLQDNDRGILVARDELAAWLNSFSRYKGKQGGSDLPAWLEMHRAGAIVLDRKTGDRRHYYVPRAAVSVCGGIQPRVLARALTGDFYDAGLAARLLMAMPPKLPKRWSEVEVLPDVETAYELLIDNLLRLNFGKDSRGEKAPEALALSAEAKAAWVKFYDEWAGEQAAVEGELAAAFSKLEAYAARFALLHHVVTHVGLGVGDCRPVGVKSVEAGIHLTRWFAEEAQRIYALLAESEEDREMRRLLEWLRSRPGDRKDKATAKELQHSNSRKYPTADVARQALDRLAADGHGQWVDCPAGPKGGRPTKDFVLKQTAGDQTD